MSTLGVDRLGEVVEQSASEIYVFAADDFRFILVNRGARENLGYSLAELSEMHPWDLKPEFSEEEFKAFVGPLLSAEVPRLSFETVHGRKDGSTYEVSVSLQLIQSQGEFVFFAAIRDISEFNSIRDRLERTSSRLDAILNNTRMAIFMMDEQQNCSFMNRAAEELTGYSFEEAVGRCLHGLIHHQYPDGSPFPIEECPIDRAFPERHQISGEDMFVHKDGNFYNVSYTASPMVDSSGSTVGTIVEAFNIDVVVAARDELAKSHRRLERSVRTFQQAEKIAKLGSWEFDVETQSLTFSDQAYKIMGLDQQRPMTLDDTLEFYSPHERERVEALYLESRRTGKNLDFTAEIVGRGGQRRQARIIAEFVENAKGGKSVMIGTVRDITEKLQAMLDLRYAASHDDLTGLLNRNAFEARAVERLKDAAAINCTFYAMLFDLTGFKFVNDTFGHQTGDKLLRRIAKQIEDAVPANAILARWGGDEFAVLSPLSMSEDEVQDFASNLLLTIEEAVDLGEGGVGVGATCGVAESTALASLDALIHKADLALYHGKAREPGTVHFYNSSMELPHVERRRAIETVTQALGEDRVQSGYQPIIQITDNRLIGFESLMRLKTADDTLIPASAVIPAIMDPILSRQISVRMFENVSRDLPSLMAAHGGVQYVSINATEADLISRDFVPRVFEALERHQINPAWVTLEITETMLMVGDNQNVKSVLDQLRSRGIRIALDDFGTGYSSLTHLRDFPIDRVKIDASFVRDICTSVMSKNIVQAMVVMSRSLGIEVIAEGIETEEQRRTLLEIGCYYGQGYLFSPAVPVDEACALRFGYSDKETA